MSNAAKRRRGGLAHATPWPGVGKPQSLQVHRRYTTEYLPPVDASRVPPTFVEAVTDNAWSGGGASRTATLPSVQAGDTIVVIGANENHNGTINTPTGGSLTYNPGPGVPGVSGWGSIQTWTTTATTTGSLVVTATMSGITDDWNIMGVVFRGSDGVGNTASLSMADGSTPSIGVSTVASKSAVLFFVNDWNAVSATGRTYLTVNSITPVAGGSGEIVGSQVASHYTLFGAYWSDTGSPGSKTVGMSAPGGQKPVMIAIEIRGAAPSAVQHQGWGMPVF